jgi:2-polyprenyl-3-methyl-5-hydroxy-6-metoxy-1,4-benzoquinol methylase
MTSRVVLSILGAFSHSDPKEHFLEMIDNNRLQELVGRAINDFGATYHSALVVLGDRLGLYRVLASSGALTPAELAAATGTSERYVLEWLNSQAAGGYIDFDPPTGRYSLSPEQALLLADESSPLFVVGGFEAAVAAVGAQPRLVDAFRTGKGIGWHEHGDGLFEGVERFFRSGYAQHLVSEWIPALSGIEDRLLAGARVADVGCGHGAATILLAQAYPRSTFVGFDYHAQSIQTARSRADAAGVADRVRFEVARAAEYPGGGFDLVTMFDCLHDLGDPVGAGHHVRSTLAADGTWMIVEPNASDRVEENLHPIGRAFYGGSTFLCTPNSLSQEIGLALGAQAGEARIREVALGAGFTSFRRAAQTPFNLIFEVKP